LFVAHHPGELCPASIGDRAGQSAISQHACHIQVFDDDPVVGLDQLTGHQVQEIPPNVGDTMVMAPQPGRGILSMV